MCQKVPKCEIMTYTESSYYIYLSNGKGMILIKPKTDTDNKMPSHYLRASLLEPWPSHPQIDVQI